MNRLPASVGGAPVISVRSGSVSVRVRRLVAVIAGAVLLLATLPTATAFHDWSGATSAPSEPPVVLSEEPDGHLLVSEVMTGGASASDEFIELYNPQPIALPLEGLEVIYVTASGGTITRKATWASGGPSVPAGAHVLLANAAGVFASIADLTYVNGLAATGGSVAIRILGASSAIDAAGWGNATSPWLEGTPAVAAAAGHSIERLPGGSGGSGQDSGQNSIDFVEITAPDPQNSLSPPIPVATPAPTLSPSGSPTLSPSSSPTAPVTPEPTTGASATPTLSATATSTPSPSLQPTVAPTPSAEPMTVAAARALPDGATVLVEGTTLTDSTFADGGGYLADATGGIAILLSDNSFPRGVTIRVSGVLDDRFSQRTIRADASGVTVVGASVDPAPQQCATGAVGEALEGELIEVSGTIASAQTVLTTGIAVDLDDGSGAIRILVGDATGVDTAGWIRGAALHLRGVVGQRDSSGTGTSGYRVQPRDTSDVVSLVPPTTPSPSPSSSASASPTPPGDPALLSIAAARLAPFNAKVRVRGIVTLPSDLADEGIAAIQDSSGAILLRLGDEAGSLQLGDLVEVFGTRSTMTGMETIRIVEAARHLGSQAQPSPRRRATGALGEPDEAVLVVVRGAVAISPRRTSANNVYFDVDDGSGPIRVYVAPEANIDTDAVLIGSWLEVEGVLGQETTGRLPDRGYRLWPRTDGDLQIISAASGSSTGGSSTGGMSGAGTSTPAGSGSIAGGPTFAGSTSDHPVAQQGVPRLALAVPTPSARAALPHIPQAAVAQRDASPVPASAGLLLLGGLLLGGAGVATGPPGLARRLLAALRERFRTSPAADEEPEGRWQAEPALPRLVPLTVLDSPSMGAAPDDARGVGAARADGGRILPPT
jgi:uncharacterized protein YdeI (BOF family)